MLGRVALSPQRHPRVDHQHLAGGVPALMSSRQASATSSGSWSIDKGLVNILIN